MERSFTGEIVYRRDHGETVYRLACNDPTCVKLDLNLYLSNKKIGGKTAAEAIGIHERNAADRDGRPAVDRPV